MKSDPKPDTRVVTVEIGGQRYPIRSSLDRAYVAELAAYVDAKMRLAIKETAAGDSLKVAVLAALNIADELFRARQSGEGDREQWVARAAALEQLLDEAIGTGGAARLAGG
ncbi:MAG: cell division protein ZapA [Vicinamibacterales bacterium]